MPVDQAVPLPDGDVVRARRRGAAAGHDRALPLPLDLRGAAGRRRARARGRRRRRAAARADGQGARRARDRHHVDGGEGRAGPRRGRGRDDRLRGLRGARARAHRRRGVRVVYDAVGRTTFEDGLDACAARVMVLYGEASGRAEPVAPERLRREGRSTSRDPACRSTRHARGAARAGRRGPELGGRGPADVRVGGRYPLGRTPAAPTRTSRRGARRESCCWSLSRGRRRRSATG